MKKPYFLLSFLCFLFVANMPASAQNVHVDWGNVEKSARRTVTTKIIGRDASGFYVLSQKSIGRDEIYLEKYDNKSNQLFQKELVFPSPDGKKVAFENILMVDDQLLMFTSFYNKKQDKNYAFVSKVSKDGTVDNKFKQIDEITAEKKRNNGNFDFILSHDSSKILVYHNEPYEKNAQERFSVKVMDKDLNILWGKEISVPFRDKDFSISNYTVSNDNKVYMLAKIQEGKREKKGGKPNYKYIVLSYAEKEKEPNEYLISLGDKFISDITFELDGKNNLTCAGFYSQKNSSGVGGTFFMKIDAKSKNVTSKNIKDFDAKILGQFMSERKAKKESSELANYDIRKLITKEDGGSVLVAEQYYVIQRTYTTTTNGVTTTRTVTYYYYNDIIMVDIAKSGDINWVTRIPKMQVTTEDGGYYSSFALCIYKDKIHLVYNDNKKNVSNYDPKKMRQMGKVKKTVTMLVTVDSKGEYTKTPLFTNKKAAAIARPKLHLQTTKDELVMQAVKGRNFMFGKLNFD